MSLYHLGKAIGNTNSNATGGNITGQISPGSVWAVDFICTLSPPKGMGGLFVGSWQTYDAEIILMGGWNSANYLDNKQRIKILLRAFISL